MNKHKVKKMLMVVGLLFHSFVYALTELTVFVSFSMPESIIHSLSVDAKKVNAGLYLRGLVNDSFKETISSIQGVVHKSGWGMTISPEHFAQFNIQQVPSFVLADVEVSGEVTRFDKVVGNISLEYALEEFTKRGELAGEAEQLLTQLHEGQDD